MAQQSKKNSFILQAGILAMAGIIVKIIGILYRSPLAAIIGDEGNGYYSYAYNIYTNILLISSYSIPSAISKVMAQKLAYKEYRNAHRIFRCAILYVVVIGGLASAFAYFAAPILVVSNAVAVLRVFVPTIFLSGLLGVLRGYFQAHRTMLQTSLSQIIEQIMNAAVSIGAAYCFVRLVSAENDHTKTAIYGAAGSALGTGSGVLIALVFMFFVYLINRSFILNRVKKDTHETEDSYGSILKTIFLVVTPFILSTFIYNCSTAVNQTIYSNIMMNAKGMTEQLAATYYGVYSGKAVVLRNVPVAIASAMSAAMIPTIAGLWSVHQKKEARQKVDQAIKVTMVIAIPCSVGLSVLAKPIILFLFPQKETVEIAAYTLMALSVTVLFYCISTISNSVLQSIGQVRKPVIHAGIALAVQSIALYGMLNYTALNIFGLVLADIIYSSMICILNALALRKHMKYRQEYVGTFIKPIIASVIMGVMAGGTYHVCALVIPQNIICLFLAVIVAVLVYFTVVLKIGGITEKELRSFPKGTMLVRYADRLHLLKKEKPSVRRKRKKSKR